MTPSPVAQILTVDVEEYFHVHALEGVVSREQWSHLPGRVEASIDRLLGLLDRHGARATFFTLGWVAERYPAVPRAIVDAGHEVASHGWWHERVATLSADRFRQEVSRSRKLLEDLTGTQVLGYRAPSFSIPPEVDWAYDVLLEEGYAYDSSVFPIRGRGYGIPNATPTPHLIERPGGELLELPMATTTLAGLRLPAAGGAYLRLLPSVLTRRALREYARRGESGVFYLHPWELDPGQPRLDVPLVVRVRHYGGLKRMYGRVDRLLGEFPFQSIAECHRDVLAALRGRERDPRTAERHSRPSGMTTVP